VESSLLCARMGRTLVSWCRRSVFVARVHPVTVRRAAFWITCRLFVWVLEMEGDQIGEA